MAKISNIVSVINQGVQAALLDNKFAGSKLSGLAHLLPDTDNAIMPYTIDLAGDGKYVGIDSGLPLQLYHRYAGATFKIDPDKQFGNSNKKYDQSCQMILMVMAQLDKVKMNSDDLEALIVSGMPSMFSSQQAKDFSLNKVVISVTGSNHDTYMLYKRELQNQQFRPDTKLIMFEIRYQIECTWDKSCINTLCCS